MVSNPVKERLYKLFSPLSVKMYTVIEAIAPEAILPAVEVCQEDVFTVGARVV
jgi:hypothetical protein